MKSKIKNQGNTLFRTITKSDSVSGRRIVDNRPTMNAIHDLVEGIHQHTPHSSYIPSRLSATIQRQKYNFDFLFELINNIDFSQTIVESSIRPGVLDQQFSDYGPNITLKNYLETRLCWINEHASELSDNLYNILVLSCTIDALAELMAKSPNVLLPRIRAKFTQLLLLHEESLQNRYNNVEGFPDIRIQAASLNGIDPIELYLKKILTKETAVEKINQMASEAKISYADCYKLLRLQFLSRLHSHPESKEKEIETKSGNANFTYLKAVGNLSEAFVKFIKQESGYKVDVGLNNDLNSQLININELSPELCTTSQPISGAVSGSSSTILPEMIPDYEIQVAVPKDKVFHKIMERDELHHYSMLHFIKKTIPYNQLMHTPESGVLEMLDPHNPSETRDRSEEYVSYRWDKESRSSDSLEDFDLYPSYGAIRNPNMAPMASAYGSILLILKDEMRSKVKFKAHADDDAHATMEEMLRYYPLKNLQQFIAGVSALPVLDMAEVVIPGGFHMIRDVKKIYTEEGDEVTFQYILDSIGGIQDSQVPQVIMYSATNMNCWSEMFINGLFQNYTYTEKTLFKFKNWVDFVNDLKFELKDDGDSMSKLNELRSYPLINIREKMLSAYGRAWIIFEKLFNEWLTEQPL